MDLSFQQLKELFQRFLICPAAKIGFAFEKTGPMLQGDGQPVEAQFPKLPGKSLFLLLRIRVGIAFQISKQMTVHLVFLPGDGIFK